MLPKGISRAGCVALALVCILVDERLADTGAWDFPLFQKPAPGVVTGSLSGVTTQSLRLGPFAQEVLQTAYPYWIFASTVLSDSAYTYADSLVSVRIGRVAVWGHELERSDTPLALPAGLAWLWHGSWLAPTPEDAGCGVFPELWSESGDLIPPLLIAICDEYCVVPADTIAVFPDITTSVKETPVRVQWSERPEVDAYGVFLWNHRPEATRVLQGLLSASEPFSVSPPGGVSMPLPGAGMYFVGVWVRRLHSSSDACEGYGYWDVFPRYALEFRSFTVNDGPTWVFLHNASKRTNPGVRRALRP